MTGWTKEAALALRGLTRARGFTVVAVLTLALGLGGSAAVYSLLDRVVLDPLPYPDADRLVQLRNQVPGVGPDERWSLSTAQWAHFTDHARTLESVGLYLPMGGNLVTAEGPRRARGVRVTESMMGLLGARAVRGRVLLPADDEPGAPRVAVLSHAFWTDVLGADPDVVGRTLTFSDRPVEVVGVLEPRVGLPGVSPALQPDLWMTLQVDRAGRFVNQHVFPGLGRMAPGATPAAVEAEVARLTPRLAESFPEAYSERFLDHYGFRTEVLPLKESVLGTLDRNLWVVFGGVLLVLAVAAANVANLFLVRIEDRGRELAIRRALGAGRGALARHLLAESVVLTGLGTALALGAAWVAVPLLAGLAPGDLPRIHGVGLTGGAVGLTLGLAVLTSLALAGWPILALDAAPRDALAGGARGGSVGRASSRVRSGLVVGQVALALTLSVGAALLLQTLSGLARTDVGFEPDGVVAVDIHLSARRHTDDVALWSFYRELLSRVEAIPGVASAGVGEEIPVRGGYGCTVQGFEDEAVYDRVRDAGQTTCAGQERVTPGYLEALGIPLVQGRALTAADHDDPGRGSVVVSRAFADRFWPGEDPIGKGVAPGGRTEPPFYTVVGVAGDVPARSSDGAPPLSQTAMAVYYPVRKHPDTPARWSYWWPGSMTLVARTDGADPSALVPAIRAAVRELDPEVPVTGVTTLDAVVDEASAELSFLSLLLLTAAAVALALSAVGLYGVVAYVVSRRTREIGMRLAVGAGPGRVVRMVVWGSLRLAAAGLVVGLGLAAVGTRVLESLLVGVEPTDPGAWAWACAVLAAVATLAAWLPARRAAGVDPAEALRAE